MRPTPSSGGHPRNAPVVGTVNGELKVKKDWEYIKLSDACTIHGRIGWQGLTRAEHRTSGDYLLITGTDFTEDNRINLDTCVYVDEFRYTQDENIQIRKNDLLITKDGTLGKLALITEELPKPATLNGGIFVIRDKINKLYPQFLLNYMKSDAFRKIIHNHRTGSTVPHLTQNMLVNFPIPVPPLEEQKRIVKILDEKFAQLETIKANAQTNLQNAKDLFQSQLTIAFGNTTWKKKKFSEFFKLSSGDYLNSKSIVKGEYPIYGGNGIIDYHKEYNLTGDNIIIGRVGALCGNARYISEPIWLTDNAFKLTFIDFKYDYAFITYLLNHINLRSFARQAAQPVISNSSLKDIEIPLPPLPEQKHIVKELDTLSEKVRQLQKIYTKQIANCDELKQSYLQKAFEGELDN